MPGDNIAAELAIQDNLGGVDKRSPNYVLNGTQSYQ